MTPTLTGQKRSLLFTEIEAVTAKKLNRSCCLPVRRSSLRQVVEKHADMSTLCFEARVPPTS
jgi:hypothetical protein